MMRTEEAVSVDQTLYVHLLGGFSLYYGTILCHLNGE